MVREIFEGERDALLKLYLHLHETSVPDDAEALDKIWRAVCGDENYHIIVNEIEGNLVSSCTCVIIPNLTRNLRPYALIENVVTHASFRGKGYATECLNYAKALAEAQNCYKMLLMTGSKQESTLKFYENAGYNRQDKTGFVQWL